MARLFAFQSAFASVVIAVSSAHRDEAYEASRHIIERIKRQPGIG